MHANFSDPDVVILSYRHPAVKEVELKYLTDHWTEVNESTQFVEAMKMITKGVYPHAAEILTEIFRRVGTKADKQA